MNLMVVSLVRFIACCFKWHMMTYSIGVPLTSQLKRVDQTGIKITGSSFWEHLNCCVLVAYEVMCSRASEIHKGYCTSEDMHLGSCNNKKHHHIAHTNPAMTDPLFGSWWLYSKQWDVTNMPFLRVSNHCIRLEAAIQESLNIVITTPPWHTCPGMHWIFHKSTNDVVSFVPAMHHPYVALPGILLVAACNSCTLKAATWDQCQQPVTSITRNASPP